MSEDKYTSWVVGQALTEGALRSLAGFIQDGFVHHMYLSNVGFYTAVNGMVRAGWWPHSEDLATREAREREIAALCKTIVEFAPIGIPAEWLGRGDGD
jgi:hypothetical protein